MEDRGEINDYLNRCFASLSDDANLMREKQEQHMQQLVTEVNDLVSSPVPAALNDLIHELKRLNDWREKVYSNRWNKPAFKLSLLLLLLTTFGYGVDRSFKFFKFQTCMFSEVRLNESTQQLIRRCQSEK
jgi:hypothetical protein